MARFGLVLHLALLALVDAGLNVKRHQNEETPIVQEPPGVVSQSEHNLHREDEDGEVEGTLEQDEEPQEVREFEGEAEDAEGDYVEQEEGEEGDEEGEISKSNAKGKATWYDRRRWEYSFRRRAAKTNCYGYWGYWSGCSKTCGGGFKYQRFYVTIKASNGGAQCEVADRATKALACNPSPCPEDCSGSWSAWSACTNSCGGGTQKATYTIKSHPFYGGRACRYHNFQVKTQACNLNRCPTSGGVTYWKSAWNTFCPVGSKIEGSNKWRECKTAAQQMKKTFKGSGRFRYAPPGCIWWGVGSNWKAYYNRNLASTYKKYWTGTICKTVPPTPVDCQGSWSEWMACSRSCSATCSASRSSDGRTMVSQSNCGSGLRLRQYTITTAKANGGKACEAKHQEIGSEICGTQSCPQSCLGEWSPWSQCTKPCGGGMKAREYIVHRPAVGTGAKCKSANGQILNAGDQQAPVCNTHACDQTCEGTWSEWSACTKTCGGGTKKRTFQVTKEATGTGGKCYDELEDGSDGDELEHGAIEQPPCNPEVCPEDCVGSWGDWTDCSVTCDGGTRTRVFAVETAQAGTGAHCLDDAGVVLEDGSEDKGACATEVCPVHCVGAWSSWSQCSATCGSAEQYRVFKVTVEQAGTGDECDHDHEHRETQLCGPAICPVNCTGAWGAWGQCDASCGGGERTRAFKVTVAKQGTGAACSATASDGTVLTGLQNGTQDTGSCNTNVCPVDCAGGWGFWSACSVTCGSGKKTRSYTVTTHKAGTGASCRDENNEIVQDNQEQDQSCENEACPVHCVGSWSEWSECSKTCDTGSHSRTFTILTAAIGEGDACTNTDAFVDVAECTNRACKVPCPENSSGDYIKKRQSATRSADDPNRGMDDCEDGDRSAGCERGYLDEEEGCDCDEGYTGTITPSNFEPYYQGICTPVECPDNSKGDHVASGCECKDGYSGVITAVSADDNGLGYDGVCESHASHFTSNLTFTIGEQVATCNCAIDGADEASKCRFANKIGVTLVAEDEDGDTIQWSIQTGDDGDLFQISASGELLFCKETLDFEEPADEDGDNVYKLTACADDGHNFTAADCNLITVTVENTWEFGESTTAAPTTTTAAPTTTVAASTTAFDNSGCTMNTLREALDDCSKAKHKVTSALTAFNKASDALRDEYLEPSAPGCWSEDIRNLNTELKEAKDELDAAQEAASSKCLLLRRMMPMTGTDTCHVSSGYVSDTE